MKYVKAIQGWVHITYDFNGNAHGVEFVPNDSVPIERRAVREEGDGAENDQQLGDDELIEHPEDIEYLESREKFCDISMVQPPPLEAQKGSKKG